MITVRVFYTKLGRAKYISHLDMMRCMTRALTRSELPVWYTQGFNPHVYLTFALPLSLGVESRWEIMDFRLEEELSMEETTSRLAVCMPEGIEILSCAIPKDKPEAICWARFKMTLNFPADQLDQIGERFVEFCEQETICVTKRSKKGEQVVDIKPYLNLEGWENTPHGFSANLRLAAGNSMNVNPSLVRDSFLEWAEKTVDYCHLTREMILTQSLEPFI